MSIMVTEIYDALIEAGASEQKARAAAQSVPLTEQLTTKQDIAALQSATKGDIAALKLATQTDIAALKTEIAELRTEIHKTILVSTGLTIGLTVTLVKLIV